MLASTNLKLSEKVDLLCKLVLILSFDSDINQMVGVWFHILCSRDQVVYIYFLSLTEDQLWLLSINAYKVNNHHQRKW